MAAHSSVLASEIPWTEEPGGLQSTWSQRADLTEQLNTHTYNLPNVPKLTVRGFALNRVSRAHVLDPSVLQR